MCCFVNIEFLFVLAKILINIHVLDMTDYFINLQ